MMSSSGRVTTPLVPFLAVGAVAVAANCHRSPAVTPSASAVTVIGNVGFSQPENLVYDSVADVYYISNMGVGNPAARDDNGFISKVAANGQVLALRWIAGGAHGATLDAPKGLAIRGDTLAIADVGAVRLFNRVTGAPIRVETLPGLVMNDVAYASDGSLWITDTGPDRTTTPVDTSKDVDAVWHVATNGKVRAVARGLFLDRPDGIVLDGGAALVATFGGNHVERVVEGAPSATVVATLAGGKVDGLRRLADGSLVATSWDAHTVWHLDAAHTPHVLLTDVNSPAGLAVDTRHHRLAVTSMQDNRLYLLPLDQ
jgi:sugar lactone lactonase YvrE